MATRMETRASGLYEQDLYAWSMAQVDLLRARRFAELDLEHLIEEIEDVGGALKRSVRNRIRTIVEHLLKLDHSPTNEPRPGWRATVRAQRVRLRDVLTPTLRQEVASELVELYGDARGLAAARSRRRRRRRCTSGDLPLQPRSDHLRLAAEVAQRTRKRDGNQSARQVLFTTVASLSAHDFWTFEGPERSIQQIQFMKNLGLIGGFLLLIGSGPGRFSRDAMRGRARAIAGGRPV